jgi:Tfp pilus assembly protein PilN
MRAVNLMPNDGRSMPGAGQVGSGAGVYLLLAGLGALVVLATLWAMAGKQVGDRTTELQRLQAGVAVAQRRAGDSSAYVAFATLARQRVGTVTTLSSTRFDWAHAMHEVSRVLPADVWLSAMTGVSGAGDAAPTPATSAAPAPTITMLGCTRSQAKVARLLARLRTIDGVRRVSLKSSEKPDAKGDAGCPANRRSDPRFAIAVAFAVPGAPKDRVDATGQIAAAAPATAAPGAGSTANAAAAVRVVSTDGKDG